LEKKNQPPPVANSRKWNRAGDSPPPIRLLLACSQARLPVRGCAQALGLHTQKGGVPACTGSLPAALVSSSRLAMIPPCAELLLIPTELS